MWKSLLPKLAIGGICAGGIVSGGVVYSNLPQKCSDYLNNKGRLLLTKGSPRWEEIKKIYNEEDHELLITINDEVVKKGELNEEKIEFWCLANSNNKFTNVRDKHYQKVSAWCTEPKAIKDLVGDERIILADTEVTSGKHPNEEQWKTKKDQYNKLVGTEQLIKEIKDSDGVDKKKTEDKDVVTTSLDEPKLRAWCKFSAEKHFKHEEDPRFKKYLKWCTVENPEAKASRISKLKFFK